MFFLKKLIQSFVLPPGLFITILGVWGIVEFRRRKKAGAGLLACAMLMYLLSTGFIADCLIQVAETRQPAGGSLDDADAIVMLGGGATEGVADLSGSGVPSAEVMGRLVDTVRLYRRLRKPVIVSGGSEPGGFSEVDVDKRFLLDLGVPEEVILVEKSSRDTVENAANIVKIVKRRGFRKVVLVTSGYHLRRSSMIFEQSGIHFTAFSVDTEGRYAVPLGWADFLPNASDLRKSSMALKEILGVMTYSIKYLY